VRNLNGLRAQRKARATSTINSAPKLRFGSRTPCATSRNLSQIVADPIARLKKQAYPDLMFTTARILRLKKQALKLAPAGRT
jgi:hypothetical protein